MALVLLSTLLAFSSRVNLLHYLFLLQLRKVMEALDIGMWCVLLLQVGHFIGIWILISHRHGEWMEDLDLRCCFDWLNFIHF